jgi:tripartite ATP-independent transporter DctM subunit
MREPGQFLALFIVSIGGIHAGVFGPTEAAAIGAFGAILLGMLGRRMSVRDLLRAIESSVVVRGLLFVIAPTCSRPSWCRATCRNCCSTARALELSGLMVMGPHHPRRHRAGMLSRGHLHRADHGAGVPGSNGNDRCRWNAFMRAALRTQGSL